MAKLPVRTIAHQTPQRLDMAKQFFTLLDPAAKDFLFVIIDPSVSGGATAKRHAVNDNALASMADWNNKGWNVFVAVNDTGSGTSRTKADVIRYRAIFIDDDGGKECKPYPLPPSLVVETSPGKKQVYWFLKGDVPADEWDGVQQTLVNEYAGDPNARDAARILRIPGYYNTKAVYDTPPMAKILQRCEDQIRYDWDTIKQHFPPSQVVSSTGKIQGETIDLAATLEQAATGTNYHDANVSLAGWYYNKGITHRDSLVNLLQAQIAVYGNNNDERFAHRYDVDIPQSVDWVIKKRKEEHIAQHDNSIDIFEAPAVTLTKHEYTTLPNPGGAMLRVVEWVESIMRYPNRTVAIIVAEHLVSVFGGGKYHIQGNTTTRKRTMLGQLGLGKNTITKALGAIVDALQGLNENGMPHVLGAENYIGSDSFSFSIQHKQIEEHRVRSFLVNEAGEGGSSKSGDLSNLRAYQLQALSTKADETLFPKRFSEQSNKKDKADQMHPVHGGVWVYLHESTISSYTNLLQQTNAFENGDISRTDIFFVTPMIDSQTVNRGIRSVPSDIVLFFAALTRGLTQPLGAESSGSQQEWEEIDTEDINEALNDLEMRIIHERNKASMNKDTVAVAMLARKVEKVMNTVLVYATADAVIKGVLHKPSAKLHHLKYALARADAIDDTLLHHSHSGALTDPFEEARTKFISMFTKRNQISEGVGLSVDKPVSGGGYVGCKHFRVTRRFVQQRMTRHLENIKKTIFNNDPKRTLDSFIAEYEGLDSLFIPVIQKEGNEWRKTVGEWYINPRIINPAKVKITKPVKRKKAK